MTIIDAFRIEQVVTNLLTNAARYGNHKPVKIRLKKNEDVVLISVTDQGQGVLATDLIRIFNRFERAISSSEVSGLGLGLYISKQIVESHGGKIWVESKSGAGSVFYVSLPLLAEKRP